MLLLVLIRAVFGLALASGLWAVAWMTSRLLFPPSSFGSPSFTAFSALWTGGFAGAATAVAWWKGDMSVRETVLYFAGTLLVAMLCSWIVWHVVQGAMHFEWVMGVGTVPVAYQREILPPRMGFTVVTTNVVAGVCYLIRSLRRSEV